VLGMIAMLWCGSVCLQSGAQADEIRATTAMVQMDQQFTQVAPYSDATNITKHFGFTVPLPEYAITNESFQLKVPKALGTNESWGLLVWISPSDEPSLPAAWDLELAEHHLLFVSPRRSGNARHPLDRFRLALDATCNMCRRYPVDRKRIYIGGFSGGSRIASMLGVAYADVYTGTLCVSGVNFYKDILAAGGQYYPATFTPNPGVLPLGKRGGRFVLLTGQHDENRANTERISTQGFKREGFRNVLYIEAPGLGHEMPPAATLGSALDYLASDPDRNASSRGPASTTP
jgi:predicted esterase